MKTPNDEWKLLQPNVRCFGMRQVSETECEAAVQVYGPMRFRLVEVDGGGVDVQLHPDVRKRVDREVTRFAKQAFHEHEERHR